MMTLLLAVMVILYVIVCLFLVVVILFQEGKGGGLSGLVGASALGDTLGASAAESTLRRWTRNCAIAFIVLSLGLTIVGSRVFTRSILDRAGVSAAEESATSPSNLEATTAPLATEVPPTEPISATSGGGEKSAPSPAKPAPTQAAKPSASPPKPAASTAGQKTPSSP